MNSFNFIGNIGCDLELKQTPNGNYVCSFSLAVRRNKDITDWFNLVAWNKTAELIHGYCKKGSKIGAKGSVQSKSYKDKNGNNRTSIEFVVDTIDLLDSKPNGNTTGQSTQQPPKATQESYSGSDFSDFEELESDEADLPF